MPSDIVGILPTKVFGSSAHLHWQRRQLAIMLRFQLPRLQQWYLCHWPSWPTLLIGSALHNILRLSDLGSACKVSHSLWPRFVSTSKAFDGKSALGCNVSLVQRITADGQIITCLGQADKCYFEHCLPQSPVDQAGLPQSSSDQPGLPQSSSDQPGLPQSPNDQAGLPQSSSDQPGLPQSPSDQAGLPQSSSDQPGLPYFLSFT